MNSKRLLSGHGLLALTLAAGLWAGWAWAAAAPDQVKVASDAAVGNKVAPIAREALVPTTNLLEVMRAGGALMWPLAFCSVICLAFVLERLISLRTGRVIPMSFVRRFVEQLRDGTLQRANAMEVCQENGSPIARVFEAAVRKWGRSEIAVEQAVVDEGERVANKLRRYIRLFTALAVITPLLGLMGTVLGMIKAFNVVADSSALGRPELLAQGISQALLNTAFGLGVAIPAQSFYYYFVSRVDRLIIAMDEHAQEVVNMISAEALESHEQTPRPKARRAAAREAEA
jgi:biopolymer transport protein ExbB